VAVELAQLNQDEDSERVGRLGDIRDAFRAGSRPMPGCHSFSWVTFTIRTSGSGMWMLTLMGRQQT
jgi:hypothetical protein